MQDTQPPDPFPLRLQILAKDTGQPVSLVEVWYRSWEGQAVPFQSLVTDQTGICDLSFPDSSKWVEVFTRLDGFADVRLRWQPERGDKIPTACTLNLARAVPLAGRVVDPDGHRVARAKVSFSSYCRHDLPAIGQVESSNGLRVEAETDSEGRWQVAQGSGNHF